MKPVAKERKEKKAEVGVIVARFQVHELHSAHRELIQYLLDNHARVIIFLGVSVPRSTINNPLDYNARHQMILESFPGNTNLFIQQLPNHKDDGVWSRNLDDSISAFTGPRDKVQLYGGRDSFIKHYRGKHPTQVLESDIIISGTSLRNDIYKSTVPSKEFRMGAIWATSQRYPTTYPTVDIIILIKEGKLEKIALARKVGEKGYRCVGGFVDPKDENLEHSARREVMEETGITIDEMKYISSHRVDDWRYRGEQDGIMTSLFVGFHSFGTFEAKDDIAELRMFNVKDIPSIIRAGLIEGEHLPLIESFRAWHDQQQRRPS